MFMDSLITFALRKKYESIEKLGDPLADIGTLFNWERFRPLLGDMYNNKSEEGGRPNFDEILMIKALVLAQWYGLTDKALEREISDKVSFMNFLGFPEKAPDSSTIWLFRERLIKTGKYNLVWDEINSQLDSLGLVIKKGVIQDATFITSDPGHAKADKPRGDEAKTRRSKDGTWAKKGSKSSFGYKLHSKVDTEFGLIRDLETTTASLHDSQVDLSNEGEVVYRDKGYFGAEAKGYSATMNRATRGHPLSIQDEMRNQRISKKRAPVERHYAVIKRVFGAAHVTVTTIARVHVKMVFTAIAFNLFQLRTLKKQNVI
jgi:IS5 family transposase